VQADIKTKNNKKIKVKVLVDSVCTHTRIDKQLVKDKRIQTRPINFSFEVFNAEKIKNREVTKVAPLEIKINGHKKQLEVVVTDLNGTDMFKDKTPLPLIGEVIDKLKEINYFNKLDLIWGYNNVQIKKGNEWKATFLTNKGLFEPQVIYFGLCNSPGTF